MPRNQWVLASATADDGAGNTHTGTYDYFGSGFHDRVEREDCGYAQVRTTREDGSTVDEIFHNQDYFRKQLLRRRIERAADGSLFRVTEVDYDAPGAGAVPITGRSLPGRARAAQLLLRGHHQRRDGGAARARARRRDFDDLGNLTAYVDEGDVGPSRRHPYAIGYYRDPAAYIFLPNSVVARDSDNACCASAPPSTSPPAPSGSSRTRASAASIPRPARRYTGARRQPHLAVRLRRLRQRVPRRRSAAVTP